MKTILLIEDNEDILENLTEYFEIKGYRIIQAKNGLSGVKLASERIPDAIVCDVLMPKMDGYEVLSTLLHTARTFEIPFIFSTSMAEKVDREVALSLGADDYIVKPFDPKELLKMVKLWIAKGTSRHGPAASLGSEAFHL